MLIAFDWNIFLIAQNLTGYHSHANIIKFCIRTTQTEPLQHIHISPIFHPRI